MKRMALLIATLLSLVIAPSSTLAVGEPDIVVVMVDDLGYTDDRILERLPNIKDLFLDNGLAFTSAYSETPLCCPGRAAFLTGQHTRKHGVTSNQNGASRLDPTNTIATVLGAAGYQTGMFGKYFNDSDLLADKTPPGWNRVVMATASTANPSQWSVDGVAVTGGYHDRYAADQSVDWLDDLVPGEPFFMWTNSMAPHYKSGGSTKPWLPAIEPQYVGDTRCSGIPRWVPPTYSYSKQPKGYPLDDICRSLLTTDDLVGRLRSRLTELGRNPVWVFVSDNGMAYGQKGCVHKNVPWAGHLPLYMAGPGIATGAMNELVSNIDIAPTLAELAGTSMPFADGTSFASLLDGIGQGREWMIEDNLASSTGCSTTWSWHAVRTPEWYFLKLGTAGGVLYDVVNDPWYQSPVPNHTALRRELKNHFPYAW